MPVSAGWFSDRAPFLRGVGVGYDPPFAPGAVAFDGSTMLYGLPTATRTSTWSLSCFVNFGDLGVAITPDPTIGTFYRLNTLTDGLFNYLQLTPMMGEPTPVLGLGARVDDDFVMPGSGFSAWPSVWAHLMASCSLTNNGDGTTTVARIIYLNDTEILNDTYAGLVSSDDPDIFGFDVTDTTDLDGLHASCIGGAYLGSETARTSPTPSGDGLQCGMAEFVMYTDRAVDWASEANRLKFHRIAGGLYLPRSIGVNGSSAFGTAPLVYLSGGSSTFRTNHGSGGGTLSAAGALVDIAGP